jgi:hypothetical protein
MAVGAGNPDEVWGSSSLSLNVLPKDATNDVADDGLMDPVVVGDGLLGHSGIHSSDVPHVLLDDFRAAVFYAERVTLFLNFVVGVVCGGADEEMGRIAAWWVVAAMQHIAAFWNGSVDALVGEAMRAYLAALFVADDTIALFVDGSGPRPAFIGSAGMVVEQEPFGEGHETCAVTTRLRTVAAALAAWRTPATVRTQPCFRHRVMLSRMMYGELVSVSRS